MTRKPNITYFSRPFGFSNDIQYPVFNAGFGIERILMIREGFTDVREAMFPQFYQAVELSDEEIAMIGHSAEHYVENARRYRRDLD